MIHVYFICSIIGAHYFVSTQQWCEKYGIFWSDEYGTNIVLYRNSLAVLDLKNKRWVMTLDVLKL